MTSYGGRGLMPTKGNSGARFSTLYTLKIQFAYDKCGHTNKVIKHVLRNDIKSCEQHIEYEQEEKGRRLHQRMLFVFHCVRKKP